MAGGRLWDEIEDAELAKALETDAERKVYAPVAAKLGRSVVACRSRAAKLGLRACAKGEPWTDHEDTVAAAARWGTIEAATACMDRTLLAVYARRHALKE